MNSIKNIQRQVVFRLGEIKKLEENNADNNMSKVIARSQYTTLIGRVARKLKLFANKDDYLLILEKTNEIINQMYRYYLYKIFSK